MCRVARHPDANSQVRRLLQHRAWPAWFAALSKAVDRAGQTARADLALPIVLYCKSGRDRSVGASVIVENWLRRVLYLFGSGG